MKDPNFIKDDKRRFTTPLKAYPTGEKCDPPTPEEKEEAKKIIDRMIQSVMIKNKNDK